MGPGTPLPVSPALLLSCSGRPFQRTVTMHKDSDGHVGFVIKRGQIGSLVKGSSAARNGLLINHYICEVNGQNVIGLKVRKTPGVGERPTSFCGPPATVVCPQTLRVGPLRKKAKLLETLWSLPQIKTPLCPFPPA